MAGTIVNGIILAVLLVIFSTIGGLIGVSIFEKRQSGRCHHHHRDSAEAPAAAVPYNRDFSRLKTTAGEGL